MASHDVASNICQPPPRACAWRSSAASRFVICAAAPGRRVIENKHSKQDLRRPHDLPCGSTLIQTRGEGGGDSTSVEYLLSLGLANSNSGVQESARTTRIRPSTESLRIRNPCLRGQNAHTDCEIQQEFPLRTARNPPKSARIRRKPTLDRIRPNLETPTHSMTPPPRPQGCADPSRRGRTGTSPHQPAPPPGPPCTGWRRARPAAGPCSRVIKTKRSKRYRSMTYYADRVGGANGDLDLLEFIVGRSYKLQCGSGYRTR